MYDLGGDLLMVASDRISTYDVVHPTPIPDKGKVLTGPVGAVVRPDAGHRAQPPRSRPPTACRTSCAAAPCGCASWRCCRSSASCAATSPARAGRTTRRTGAVSGDRAARRPAGVRAAARADLHAVDQGRGRPRRGDRLRRRRSSCVGGEELAAQLRDVSLAVYKRGGRARARARRSSWPTRSSSSGSTTTACSTLGDEVCTPDSSRFWPADSYEVGHGQPSFDKQYVRDWASGTGWDKTPPGAADPRRRRRGTRASATSRPTSGSRASRSRAWLDRVAA